MNTHPTHHTQQNPTRRRSAHAFVLVLATLFCHLSPASAADKTWNGAGADSLWLTGGNWGGSAPVAADGLFFAGSTRLTNTNNFTANTAFGGITFNSGAGAFQLYGNVLNLGANGITNNSANSQTLNLPIALTASTTINAASNNVTVAGNIGENNITSGGFGVATFGTNIVTLSGSNIFTGTLTVNAGKTVVSGSIISPNAASGAMVVQPAAGVTAVLDISGASILLGGANTVIGTIAGGAASMVMNSGSLSTGGGGGQRDVRAGQVGYGAIDLNGGNIYCSGFLVAGITTAGAVGIWNINGGNIIVSNAQGFSATLGATAGTTGLVNVVNGSYVANDAGTAGMLVGENGVGFVNISGGGVVNVGSPTTGGRGLVVGNANNAVCYGLVNLGGVGTGGGTLRANRIQKPGAAATGILNFHGGTLKPSVANASFLTGLSAANVFGEGAVVDTSGLDVTIGQALLAPTNANGVVSIALAANGSGYINTPHVMITGGGGSNATAVAQVNRTSGTVTNILITNPGTGYTNGAVVTVNLAGGGGSGATIGAVTVAPNTSGGLTKNGLGMLTLSGANTYTNTTALNTGALTVSGSLASPVTVASGTALTNSGSINGSVTVSGTLAGGGGINGAVTINSGGTRAGTNTITGAVTVASGGTFRGSGFINGALALSAGGASLNLQDGAAATLTVTNGLTLTDSSALSFDLLTTAASDKIVLTSGSAVANSASTTPVAINLAPYAGFGAGTYDLITGGSIASTANYQLGSVPSGYSFTLQAAGGSLQVVVTQTGLSAAFWKGDVDGNWNTGGGNFNWDTDATSGIDSGAFPSGSTLATFTANGAANLSTTLGQDFNIGGLAVTNTVGSVTIGGANALSINSGGITVGSAAAGVTLSSSAVTLAANQTWANNSAGTLSVSATVGGSGKTLTVGGSGVTSLSGANTYNGGTVVSSGTLAMGSSSALGTGLVTAGGGKFTNNVAGNVTVANTLSLASGTQVGVNGGDNLTLSGVISGTGSLTNAGTGTLTLSGADTFTGGLVIPSGTVALGAANVLADAGAVTVNGGTLSIGANSDAVGVVTLNAGAITGSSGTLLATSYSVTNGTISANLGNGAGSSTTMLKTGVGTTVTLSGNNTYQGGTTVNAGKLVISGSLISGPNFGSILINPTATTNAVVDISGATIKVGANVAGNAAVLVGTTTAGGNASLVMNSGSLTTGDAGASREIHVGRGGYGAFDLNGGTVTINGFFVSGINAAASVGIWNINGGSVTVSPFANYGGTIGATVNTTGVVSVASGSYSCVGVGTFGGLMVGENGFGFLNVSGSGVVNAGGANAGTPRGLSIGQSSAATVRGMVNLGAVGVGGGTIVANRVQKAGALATGTLNFHGGILKPTISNAAFINNSLTAAYVYSAGAVIDTAGFDVAVAQPLLPPSGSGVATIPVTATGAAYINTPLVVIAGDGTDATAIAQVDRTAGTVTNILITNPGNNYSSATVGLVGGGGTGVTFGSITFAANTSGGLKKLGAGTLTLSAVNTYTGNTTVSNGTIAVSSTGSTDPGSAVAVTAGTTLTNSGTVGGPATVTGTLTGNGTYGGTVTLNSGGTRSGANTINGAVTINAGGTFRDGGTVNNSVTLNAGNAAINLQDGAAATLTITSGLNVTNGNVLSYDLGTASDLITLSGGSVVNNSTTTPVTINLSAITGFTQTTYDLITGAGLSVTNGFILGTVPPGYLAFLKISGGNLQVETIQNALSAAFWKGDVNATWTTSSPSYNWDTDATSGIDAGGIPNGPTAVTFAANGAANFITTLGQNFTVNTLEFKTNTTVAVGGNNSLSINNGITVSAGNVTISNSSVILSGSQAWTNTAGTALTVTAPISGSGRSLTTVGSIVLSGVNTYNGGTLVSSGTLSLANSTNTLADGSAVVVDIGTLALGANSDTVGSVTLTNGSITGSSGLLTGTSYDVQNGTISASLGGTGPLNKSTVGTVSLSGANTYTGNTTVSNGTLAISGGLSAAAGNIIVAPAADSAVVNVLPGASITRNNLQIGSGTAAGAVVQTGGAVSQTQAANVADFRIGAAANAYGYYKLSGGTLTANEIGVGSDLAGSVGVMDITGGSYVSPGYVTIARGVGSLGVLNVTGGSMTLAGTVGSSTIGLMWNGGGSSFGVLNVNSGGTVTGPSNTTFVLNFNPFGGFASQQGIVNLITNGTLQIGGVRSSLPGVGTSLLNFDGGTLKATVANSSYFTNSITAAYVFDGGAIIDDNGAAIAITQPLLAPAGYGVNSIPVSSGGSGYIGAPFVSLTGGSGQGATAIARIAGGAVISIEITSPGSGYDVSDVLTAALVGGGGTGASLAAVALIPNISGGLTKNGSGTLTLSAPNTYTGVTRVNNGTLSLLPGFQSAAVSVADAAQLTVTGTNASAATTTGLTLGTAGATTLSFSYGFAGNPSAPALVTGPLTVNGTCTVRVAGSFAVGAFPVLQYSGAIGGGGAFNSSVLAPRGVVATLSNDTVNAVLYVKITSLGSGIVWTGTNGVSPNLWDLNTTTNWLITSSPTTYLETLPPGDAVTFNDIGSGSVTLNTNASPLSMLVSNPSVNYLFQGSGRIAGSTGLVKKGAGTVTMNLVGNTYTGDTVISNGTFQVGSTNSLPDSGGTVLISSAGKLDLAGFSETINGLAGSGTIDNSSGTASVLTFGTANGSVIWGGTITNSAGGSSFLKVGSGDMVISNNNYLASAAASQVNGGNMFLNAGGSLLMTGGGEFWVMQNAGTASATVDGGTLIVSNWLVVARNNAAAVGTLTVNSGLVQKAGGNNIVVGSLGANGTLTVNGGQVLNNGMLWLGENATATAVLNLNGGLIQATQVRNQNPVTSSQAIFNGGTLQASAASADFISGSTIAYMLAGGLVLDDNGFNIQLTTVPLTDLGGGGLVKKGSGTVSLNHAANTYSGLTIVSNGTLLVNGTIPGSVTVRSGATLGGTGTIGTDVSVDAGGILTAGASIGTLNITGNLSLSGNVLAEVNTSQSPSNDLVSVTGTLNKIGGGTVTVSNLGPALVAGRSFKLFNQPLVNGGGMTIVTTPALGAGLGWTNGLAVDGTIGLVQTVALNPTNITTSVSGNQLTLTWPSDHLGWVLQAQTNSLSTGLGNIWFDVAGSGSSTTAIYTLNPANPTVFFRLRSP